MNTLSKKAAVLIALSFFKTYPSVNTFHITSDEQAFENAADALNNAKQLDPKNPLVISVNREDSEAVILDEQILSDNPKLKTGEAAAVTGGPVTDDIALQDTDPTQIPTPDNTVAAQAGGDDATLSTASKQIDNGKANAVTAKNANKPVGKNAGTGKGKGK